MLEPSEMGSRVHSILAKAASSLRGESGFSQSLSENLEQSRNLFIELAREVFSDLPFDDLFWDKDLIKVIGGLEDEEEGIGYLMALLILESGKNNGEKIRFVEASFGHAGDKPGDILFDEPLEYSEGDISVQLRGQIDRVSLHPKKGWRVFDYKTGKTPVKAKKAIQLGIEFQLPVYILAFKKWLSDNATDDTPLDIAACLQMANGKMGMKGQWSSKNHDADEHLLVKRLIKIKRAMMNGHFHHPLTENEDACNDTEYFFCPFKEICRRDFTVFAERKRQPAGRQRLL